MQFLQPHHLVQELPRFGCFILPSRSEPWGVVVHEFAAAGFPLLLSDVVGSARHFLIDGLNGFSFNSDSVASLTKSMKKIISLSDDKLYEMGSHSITLSSRITPHSSAANLLSVLQR